MRMEVIQRMKEIMEKYAPEIELRITESDKDNYLGIYFQDEAIGLNIKRLKKQYDTKIKEYFSFSSFDEFLYTIFIHELGHHIDRKKGLFKAYKDAHYELYDVRYYGQRENLKSAYTHYASVRYEMEVRAWNEALHFLTNDINIENFNAFRTFCLSSYQQVPRKEYRVMVMETKLARDIYTLFGDVPTFFLYFDHEEENHVVEDLNLCYLNLTKYVTRKVSKKRNISIQKEALLETLHFIFEHFPTSVSKEEVFNTHKGMKKDYETYIKDILQVT